jgi:putative transposase
MEYATLEWVDRFNNRRLLEPIGTIAPAEFEVSYYTEQEVLAVGVQSRFQGALRRFCS